MSSGEESSDDDGLGENAHVPYVASFAECRALREVT